MMSHRTLLIFFALTVALGAYAADSARSKAMPPNVVVSLQRFVREHEFVGEYDYLCAEFAVSNCTSRAVWFTGYSLETPVYDFQYLKDNEWEDSPRGYCGVGMKRQRLPAHTSIKFTVLVEHGEEKPQVMRVGISCSPQKDYKKETEKTYWSEKIKLKR